MAVRERIRVGGRSARIQSAVQDAVTRLGATTPREELTVPQIAAEAGVTPSTIYRRWGDLSALLAQADRALYRAKDSGRNRVEIASIELILDRVKRGAADLLAATGGRASAAKSMAKSAAKSAA